MTDSINRSSRAKSRDAGAVPSWRIRRATPADADACALIAGAAFLEAFAGILAHVAANSNPAKFAAWIDDPESVVTLAEAISGAAPIAYAVLTTPDLPVTSEPGDIELKRIYALAPFHGTGLAAALMDRATADARALGKRRMLLGVYGGNARAQRFYEKMGFAIIGERRFLVGSTWHDDLVYGRSI